MKRGIIIRDMNAYGLPEWIPREHRHDAAKRTLPRRAENAAEFSHPRNRDRVAHDGHDRRHRHAVGEGAIALLRLSGPRAVEMARAVFRGVGEFTSRGSRILE